MTPDMSVAQILDRLIFITKGSRVIDRKETSWGRLLWLDDKYVKNMVYSVADLKRLFAHRVVKSKYAYERRDPFGEAQAPTALDSADAVGRDEVRRRGSAWAGPVNGGQEPPDSVDSRRF